MSDELSRIPALTDHKPYAEHIAKLAELKGKLETAKTELLAHGDGPAPSAESHADADLDRSVEAHMAALEKHGKAKTKATIKVAALDRALRIESERTAELRAQAEDNVKRGAAAEHGAVINRLLELRQEASNLLLTEAKIRERARNECNRDLPGFVSFSVEVIPAVHYGEILPHPSKANNGPVLVPKKA